MDQDLSLPARPCGPFAGPARHSPTPAGHQQQHSALLPPTCSKTIQSLPVYILLLALSIHPLLAIEIFNQREPGEATSSLIQVSGLTAGNGATINETTTSISETAAQQQQATGPMVLLVARAASNLTTGNGSNSVASSSNNNSNYYNNSASSAHSPASDEDDRPLIIAIMTANIIIFIVGFIGNSVVILVILKFTKIETVTDIYILNLAVADLMFITGLVFLITTMFIGDWIFGYLMCKLYMASTSLNQFASSLLLVVMSFDRFLAVCHPIYAQRFRRIKRAKIICLCIWVVCLILMSPIFAFAKISKDLTCAIFWPEYKNFNCEVAFTMYSFAIGFAVPLLLIAAFYLCVIKKLRVAASGPSLGSRRRSRSRENTNRRIEHLVIGIICTYTICWLPYWMTQLCVSFITNNTQPVPGFYGIFLTASSLSYTNSALNPILYAFLSDNFKRRCSEILRTIYSFRMFRNCSGGKQAGHSYQAPPPTTTGCYETETTKPDPKSALYLNETAKFMNETTTQATTTTTTTTPGQQTLSQHHQVTNSPEFGGVEATAAAAGDWQRRHLERDDTDDDTGSSTIALSCLNINNTTSQSNHRRKSVNFSSSANIIMSPLNDCEPSKSYHKILGDQSRCQGV